MTDEEPKKCPKCGKEIDDDLEDGAILVLSSPYIIDQDEKRENEQIPGDKLDAMLWYARYVAEQALHRCGHEEKVK